MSNIHFPPSPSLTPFICPSICLSVSLSKWAMMIHKALFTLLEKLTCCVELYIFSLYGPRWGFSITRDIGYLSTSLFLPPLALMLWVVPGLCSFFKLVLSSAWHVGNLQWSLPDYSTAAWPAPSIEFFGNLAFYFPSLSFSQSSSRAFWYSCCPLLHRGT